jgi:predicted RNA binding protein with dsRBD fold (UPF0201 family)
MTEIYVFVKTKVHPTESSEKVEVAVRNVLGDIPLNSSSEGDLATIEGRVEGLESLGPLRSLIMRTMIRDAARALFTRSVQGDTLSFGLNKQAAYVGRVSFHRSGESQLGPIQIIIKGDTSAAIRYLCGKG